MPVRRRRWRRAAATIRLEPGPSWRIGFTLPDGTPVSVVTCDLRLPARREGEGPVTIPHDPGAASRGVDLPRRPGLGLACGIVPAGLGVAAVAGVTAARRRW